MRVVLTLVVSLDDAAELARGSHAIDHAKEAGRIELREVEIAEVALLRLAVEVIAQILGVVDRVKVVPSILNTI